jgi:hypothetical protein
VLDAVEEDDDLEEVSRADEEVVGPKKSLE